MYWQLNFVIEFTLKLSLIHKINKDNEKLHTALLNDDGLCILIFKSHYVLFVCLDERDSVKVHYCQIRHPLTTENYNSKMLRKYSAVLTNTTDIFANRFDELTISSLIQLFIGIAIITYF